MYSLKVWVETHRDWFIEFIRIFIGLVLILKGIMFLDEMGKMVPYDFKTEAGMGWAYANLAHFIIFANIIGGIFIMIGLLTRVVIPFQFPVLLIAGLVAPLHEVYFKGGSPFEVWMLIVLLVLMMLYGSGRISVDHYIRMRMDWNR